VTQTRPGAGLPLFKNLSLTIKPGQSTVIMGPSGCGKTTLLRTIAGLWTPKQGQVVHPVALDERPPLCFLPQRSYLCEGSLAAQLTYPRDDTAVRDRRAMGHVLEEVGLGYLLEEHGLDSVMDWASMLSGGEQQRLGLARVLYTCPVFAVMDEATSALDELLQQKCLRACLVKGITLVSVVHRPSAIPYHDQLLEYTRDEGWQMKDIDHSLKVQRDEIIREEGIPASPYPPSPTPPSPVEEEGVDTYETYSSWRILLYYFRKITARSFCSNPSVTLLFMMGLIGCGAMAQCMLLQLRVTDEVLAALGYKASEDYPLATFWVLTSTSLTTVGILCNMASMYLGSVLAMYFRKACTFTMTSRYYFRKVLYAVSLDSTLTEVPAKLSSDQAAFAEYMSWLFGSPFAFQQPRAGMLLELTQCLMYAAALCLYGAAVPTLMVVGYVLVAMSLQLASTAGIARVQARLLDVQGQYRRVHVRVQEYCESIVFFGGAQREATRALDILKKKKELSLSVALSRGLMGLTSVMIGQSTSIVVVSFFAIQHFYISTFSESEVLSVFGFFGGIFLQSTILLPWNAIGLSALGGYLQSMHKFQLKIDSLQGYATKIAEHTHERPTIVLSDVLSKAQAHETKDGAVAHRPGLGCERGGVTAFTPTLDEQRPAKLLVENLNLEVLPSNPMCIMGPSGCGKSSLLRVLGGLWSVHSGQIARPLTIGQGGIFFLPQNSYTTHGTLREQLLYPLSEDDVLVTDAALICILDFVDLNFLGSEHGLHAARPWADILSGGEMQRLGFARLFFHSPRYAILDEATSALDIALEARCLSRCRELGITLVSVAHRPSAAAFHATILRLDGTGNWSWIANPNYHK